MYDMAKRSLAFTVATGGLLLTGTGYASADSTGAGVLPGQAQARESDGANQASPSSVSTPIGVREVPQQRSGSSGGNADATAATDDSGGILSGNTVQIPIDLGLNLCGNQAVGIGARNSAAGSTCSASSGADATSSTSHSGGIASGNTIQAPIDIPLNVCGNQGVIAGVVNTVAGGTCSAGGSPGSGTSGGANASASNNHSGGILSGNIIQAPVNVPLNACGNQGIVGGFANSLASGACDDGPGDVPNNSPSGANAMGSVSDSGGILSGDIVQTPINVPVNACGNAVNAVAVEDDDTGGATCDTTTPSATGSSVVVNSGGIGSGNQVTVPINVPVNICGNAVTVVGVDNTTGGAECSQSSPSAPPSGSPSGSPSPRTSGSGSPSPSPSGTRMMPPPSPSTAPGAPSGLLAHTGTDEVPILGAAAVALFAGLGLRAASKRRAKK